MSELMNKSITLQDSCKCSIFFETVHFKDAHNNSLIEKSTVLWNERVGNRLHAIDRTYKHDGRSSTHDES